MATNTCLFKLEWENNTDVKLSRKDEGEEVYLTIIYVQENGTWADWDAMALQMNNCFKRKVEAVGKVMKG